MVVFVTAVMIAFTVLYISRGYFEDVATKNFQSKTRMYAANIENALQNVAADIDVLSRTPPINGIIRSVNNGGDDVEGNSNLALWQARLATIFQSMLQANEDYTMIRYIGVADNGKELVRVDRHKDELFTVPVSTLQQKGDRGYFKDATSLSPGTIQFSEIDYNRENGKLTIPLVTTLRVYTPIYRSNQEVFGALVINVHIKRYLQHVLANSKIDSSAIIRDASGNYFYYDREKNSITYQQVNAKKSKANSKDDATFKSIMNNHELVKYTVPIFANTLRDHEIMSFTLIEKKDLLYDQIRFLLGEILFVIFSICLLMSALIYYFSRALMSNLSDMANNI